MPSSQRLPYFTAYKTHPLIRPSPYFAKAIFGKKIKCPKSCDQRSWNEWNGVSAVMSKARYIFYGSKHSRETPNTYNWYKNLPYSNFIRQNLSNLLNWTHLLHFCLSAVCKQTVRMRGKNIMILKSIES